MHIVVDGDSCPADRRTLLVKAGARINAPPLFFVNTHVQLTVVGMRIIRCSNADKELIAHCQRGDIAITRDLLLAQQLVRIPNVSVMDYCGRPLTADSLPERLAYRKHLLSGTIMPTRGAPGDLRMCRKEFANALDRTIAAHAKQGKIAPHTREGT